MYVWGRQYPGLIGSPAKIVRSKPTLLNVNGATIKNVSMSAKNIAVITNEGKILINTDKSQM